MARTARHLELSVRRFFCDVPDCRQQVFAERLPATAATYARHTHRAAAMLQAIGFAAGGRPALAWQPHSGSPPLLP